MKQAYAILYLLLLFGLALSAQPNTDSLWQTWQNTDQPDTARLEVLQQLAYSYVHNDPDSARAVAELELDFSRQQKLPQ